MNRAKSLVMVLLIAGLASGCDAGWLNPSQPGFVIQTFTSYDPISGNNSGTIATNGNSFQFAGDNTGYVFMGGPGSQFRGKNDGNVYVNGDGAFVLGTFASLAMVTNKGKGSLLLGNLSAGQRAMITDVASASIVLGAGTASNSQAIVVGDGNTSHGTRSVTADSLWATGSGFHGSGAALTNLPVDPYRVDVRSNNTYAGGTTQYVFDVVASNRVYVKMITDDTNLLVVSHSGYGTNVDMTGYYSWDGGSQAYVSGNRTVYNGPEWYAQANNYAAMWTMQGVMDRPPEVEGLPIGHFLPWDGGVGELMNSWAKQTNMVDLAGVLTNLQAMAGQRISDYVAVESSSNWLAFDKAAGVLRGCVTNQ